MLYLPEKRRKRKKDDDDDKRGKNNFFQKPKIFSFFFFAERRFSEKDFLNFVAQASTSVPFGVVLLVRTARIFSVVFSSG